MEIEPNNCRICLTVTQEAERQLLINEDGNLTIAGTLYENVLGLPVVFSGMVLHYVCNTCDLQLKLFKELKGKALETQQLLSTVEEDDVKIESVDTDVDLKHELIEEVEEAEAEDEECGTMEEVEFLLKEYETHIDDEAEEEEYIDEERLSDIDDDVQDESCSLEADDTADESVEIATGNHQCADCYRTFRLKSYLINHRKKAHPKTTKYTCPLCPKSMYSSEALEVHLNIHKGLPAYQCKLCEKTFNQKVHYTYHMMNHENVRNKICEVCNKKFISKSDLKIHMRIHTDERRYKCDICEKSFRAHTHMVNHRYSHFEKQFECPSCFQMYSSPNTLRTHFRAVHIGEVPFECEFCEKKFKRKHHLHAHYKTHSKVVETVIIEEQI